MALSPRYGGTPIIVVEGDANDPLVTLARQRRRFQASLEGLDVSAWRVQSRCAGWSVQDVIAHLAGVNRFWLASVRAGLDGAPTRYLAAFDPVATPELLVAPTRVLPALDVLESFAASNDELLELLESLSEPEWEAIAETPPGHLPVRLLAAHALWDAWVHERDVLLPLGATQERHPDEVGRCLQYVCALVAATALLAGAELPRALRVDATDPAIALSLELSDHVLIRTRAVGGGDDALCGDAVDLVEVLSTRARLPHALPATWETTLRPFATVFAPPG